MWWNSRCIQSSMERTYVGIGSAQTRLLSRSVDFPDYLFDKLQRAERDAGGIMSHHITGSALAASSRLVWNSRSPYFVISSFTASPQSVWAHVALPARCSLCPPSLSLCVLVSEWRIHSHSCCWSGLVFVVPSLSVETLYSFLVWTGKLFLWHIQQHLFCFIFLFFFFLQKKGLGNTTISRTTTV